MPIYEYQCLECRHDLEVIQGMNDPELKDCPECGKSELKRVISPVGFRLKGGGWYETDFKSGKKKNVAGDSGGESTKSDSKSESATKTESSSSKSSTTKSTGTDS